MNTKPAQPQAEFWQGKRVLLTGHTGFKGAWLALWLQALGARVTGLALAPHTTPSLFGLLQPGLAHASHIQDVRDAAAVQAIAAKTQPDIVLHLAAQALVRQSYRDPLETWSSNVMGTANVLEAVRATPSVRVVVVVTTDKVYANREWPYPYRETDPLGGHDAYSASKAACELVVASYRDAFLRAQGVAVASARAGNVIGGGDWAANRLIPDAVRAWSQRQPLALRNPASTRPWQHVLEPLSAYLVLAQRLWVEPTLAGAYNFGPEPQQVSSVENVMKLASSPDHYCAVSYENNLNQPHETGLLALETAQSRKVLGVQPRWSLEEAVARTMAWYRSVHDGGDARTQCLQDLSDFTQQVQPPSGLSPQLESSQQGVMDARSTRNL
jgi:CDP-glucose 4,6-dehydratase